MAQRNPSLRRVGLITFTVGILIGLLITLLRAVPDLEASQYGFIKYGYPRLTSLACPVMMTVNDHENVTIRLHNSLDHDLKFYVVAQLSAPILFVTSDQTLELSPGENRKLAWQVDDKNMDLGNFIFARVFTSAAAANGFREASCGTFVINMPFEGGPVAYWSLLFLAVLLMLLGITLWYRNRNLTNPADRSRFGYMAFISIVVFIGIFSSLFGFWFVGILAVLLSVLCSAVYLSQSDKSQDISFDSRR